VLRGSPVKEDPIICVARSPGRRIQGQRAAALARSVSSRENRRGLHVSTAGRVRFRFRVERLETIGFLTMAFWHESLRLWQRHIENRNPYGAQNFAEPHAINGRPLSRLFGEGRVLRPALIFAANRGLRGQAQRQKSLAGCMPILLSPSNSQPA